MADVIQSRRAIAGGLKRIGWLRAAPIAVALGLGLALFLFEDGIARWRERERQDLEDLRDAIALVAAEAFHELGPKYDEAIQQYLDFIHLIRERVRAPGGEPVGFLEWIGKAEEALRKQGDEKTRIELAATLATLAQDRIEVLLKDRRIWNERFSLGPVPKELLENLKELEEIVAVRAQRLDGARSQLSEANPLTFSALFDKGQEACFASRAAFVPLFLVWRHYHENWRDSGLIERLIADLDGIEGALQAAADRAATLAKAKPELRDASNIAEYLSHYASSVRRRNAILNALKKGDIAEARREIASSLRAPLLQ